MKLNPVRRVVTGHDGQGRAVVAMDGAPPNVFDFAPVPGTVFHEIWRTDASPARVDSGPDPTLGPVSLAPSAGGSLVRVVDFPPDSEAEAVSGDSVAEVFAAMGAAGAATGADGARHKLMHRTQTIDYGVMLSGELWMILDQDEVRLRPGDIVIQRGTNHAWSNRSREMARMLFVLLDGGPG
jgi:quercetin dioxygenase-like cupin family protein